MGSDLSQYEFGGAYVFTRAGTTWSQEAKIEPPNLEEDDAFGRAVAIQGDTAVIGAPYDDASGNAGAVYVFQRIAGQWTEVQKLIPEESPRRREFGVSVALDGEWLAVGTPYGWGGVYVYRREFGVWVLRQILLSDSDFGWWGRLGHSVAMKGNNLITSAPWEDNGRDKVGSRYFYRFDGWQWKMTARVMSSDSFWRDKLGDSVALDGEHVVVGCSYDDDAGAESGSAYVFGLADDGFSNLLLGPGPGSKPWASVYTPNGIGPHVLARGFEDDFTDGVFVASGAVRGICSDADEIVIAPDGCDRNECVGGRMPELQIFDVTGELLESAVIYGENFRNGIRVACGDINGDGADEIVIAKDAGIGETPSKREPRVLIYDHEAGEFIGDFLAFGAGFRGGVRVACGDLAGDGRDEIIVTPGRRGGPHLRVFDNEFRVVGQWRAYKKTWKGGVYVASGNVCPERGDEVVTGPSHGGAPQVRIFHSDGSICNGNIRGFTTNPKSGIRVAVGLLPVPGTGLPSPY